MASRRRDLGRPLLVALCVVALFAVGSESHGLEDFREGNTEATPAMASFFGSKPEAAELPEALDASNAAAATAKPEAASAIPRATATITASASSAPPRRSRSVAAGVAWPSRRWRWSASRSPWRTWWRQERAARVGGPARLAVSRRLGSSALGGPAYQRAVDD